MNAPNTTKPVVKRFIVSSAQEAVTQIREVLGPDAQVVSVRQVKGSGLQRFLASPRLEIIARGPTSEAGEASVSKSPQPSEDSAQTVDKEYTKKSAAENVEADAADADLRQNAPRRSKKRALTVEERLQQSSLKDMKCGQFLERAGFSEMVLSRLGSHTEWRAICELPIKEGLTQAVFHLREDRKRRPQPVLTQKIAFVGGAGSGKTTAICKMLARDTFIRNLSPQVLRIEADKPHMDDGLPLYCDVLGIRCCRSESELDLQSDAPIYIDVPGYSLTEPGELQRIGEALDKVGVASRVLVMNGAYESSILRRFSETGDRLGAQFQIISHVDELIYFGKLWEFLFDTKRHLISFSNGQNVASDLIEDAFGFLIERTFPR